MPEKGENGIMSELAENILKSGEQQGIEIMAQPLQRRISDTQ